MFFLVLISRKAHPVSPSALWARNFPCGLLPQVLTAWYLQGSANEWAGGRGCGFDLFFFPGQHQRRSSFWRVEHLTCIILSVRMQIYLFKAVFKVTLITGLPTDRAAMIIQSINQGKNYASYWLTNYRNQIFTPLFGTMGTVLGKGDNNNNSNKKNLKTKNSCFNLQWARGRLKAPREDRGLQLRPLSLFSLQCIFACSSLQFNETPGRNSQRFIKGEALESDRW